MVDSMFPYIILSLAGVFFASISQVILKKAALKEYKNVIQEYLNPWVIGAYILFFGTTFLGVLAYKGLPVSLGPVLETTAYVYITLFGVFIFKEKITLKKAIALALIIAGVLLCAFS